MEEKESLKKRAVKGIKWIVISSAIIQSFQFIIKIILARILLPEEFGLVAISLLVISFFTYFNEFGIGSALIHRKKNIKEASSTGFFIVILIGVFFTAFVFFISPLVALFFNNFAVEGIMKFLALVFLVSSFGIIPLNLLNKELEFKKLILPEVGSVIAYALITIPLALIGFSYWSLVYGYFFSILVSTVLAWIACSWRPSFKFDKKIALELINYGKFILGGVLVAFLLLQGVDFFIGRILGATALGLYGLAFALSNLPATNITHVVAKISFPLYSKLQDKKSKLKNAYTKITYFAMLIVFPVSLTLMILAKPITIIIFTDKWAGMIPIIQVLSIFAIFRSLHIIASYLFQGIGKPEINQNLLIAEVISLGIIIYPMITLFGVIGGAIALTVVMAVGGSWAFFKCTSLVKESKLKLLKTLGIPFIFSLAIGALIFITENYFAPNSIISLLSIMLAGFIAYALLIFLFRRETILEIMDLCKLMLKR
ncbi:MAG: lipopolysaccharide biosynthesis protein [archaeon]